MAAYLSVLRPSRGSLDFLSDAQHRYVMHCCQVLAGALDGDDGEVTIDMDAVAQAVGKEGKTPAFFVSEHSQQRKFKFKCIACNAINDILGRCGYCSSCGSRNEVADFESEVIPGYSSPFEPWNGARGLSAECHSAFDSFVAQLDKAKSWCALFPWPNGVRSASRVSAFTMRLNFVP